MDDRAWIYEQLEQTGKLFVWALEQVPDERRTAPVPGRPDEWTAMRHAFHMLCYERELVLPGMMQWLGGATPNLDALDEDAEWTEGHAWDTTLAALRLVRAQQIALLERFEPAAWEEPRDRTPWDRWAPEGGVTLRWVLTKTVQHTAEHTHSVLRLALMWDYSARKAATSIPPLKGS